MAAYGNGTAAAPDERDRLAIRIDADSPDGEDAYSPDGEDSPLLGKADDRDDTTQAPWHWEMDFEGVPWYRKPSVSSPPPALTPAH